MNNKSIYTKLMEARVEFHKLELKKSGFNKFAGFKYYELSDFLIPGTVILQKYNLCPIITFDNEMATMTLVNGDNPEEKIEFTSPMRKLELKGCNEIQALGGVQTYISRYLWIQCLSIVEGDSFDPVSGKEDKEVPSRVQSTEQPKTMKDLTGATLTDKQVSRLLMIGKSAGQSVELIKKVAKKDYGVEELNQLSKKDYDALCNRLEKIKK